MGRTIGKRDRLVTVVTAALFLIYVHYLPFHLSFNAHSHDGPMAGGEDHDHPHDPSHPGHEEHHVPHPSSEHDWQMPAKSKQTFLEVDFTDVEPEATVAPPPALAVCYCVAGETASSLPPPDPRQPRAPPLS